MNIRSQLTYKTRGLYIYYTNIYLTTQHNFLPNNFASFLLNNYFFLQVHESTSKCVKLLTSLACLHTQ